jgi:Flp pilus assembly pilin Flp
MMKGRPLHNLSAYLRDEQGGSAAEYALILSLVCIVLIGGIIALRDSLITAIDRTDNVFTAHGF